ncbi:MAG: hypothetical protein ACXVP1_05350 [Thermoleophilia bacterium]
MAGFILVCTRNGASPRFDAAGLGRCALRLSPGNIEPHEPQLFDEAGILRAVVNPVAGVRSNERGICLGALFEDADWSTPQTPPPDGSYAIVRHDAGSVELVADAFASRTIWYVLTDDCFLASTSQRALATLLGDFQANAETVAWMISSGYLGPEHGWDARVRRVAGGVCLRLDRATWKLSSTARRIEYRPVAASRDEHIARLREAVFTACRDVDLSGTSWVLPLSGGHDSRALLVGLLRTGARPLCVTWGLSSSLDQPGNDAYVAQQLTAHFGLEHRYCPLDPTGEPMRDVLTRFLLAGEGRAEDFSAYTDGMKTWEELFNSGVSTVVRGDTPGLGSGQGRPYDPVNDFKVRAMIGRALLVDDYPDGHVVRRLGLAPQHFPSSLRRRSGESLGCYRDRMHNEYKLATMFAALNDPKCAYVEVANPLLHRAVIKAVSELPDELRQWEVGYADMVGCLVPEIPFDKHHAEPQADELQQWSAMLEELLAELSRSPQVDVLPPGARARLVAELKRPAPLTPAKVRMRRHVKAWVPARALRLVPPRITVGTRLVCFHAYIASRMATILGDDARPDRAESN